MKPAVKYKGCVRFNVITKNTQIMKRAKIRNCDVKSRGTLKPAVK